LYEHSLYRGNFDRGLGYLRELHSGWLRFRYAGDDFLSKEGPVCKKTIDTNILDYNVQNILKLVHGTLRGMVIVVTGL
jgi:hypothetical protein